MNVTSDDGEADAHRVETREFRSVGRHPRTEYVAMCQDCYWIGQSRGGPQQADRDGESHVEATRAAADEGPTDSA